MEFLIAPLYLIAAVLGILTLAGIVITACQRGENNINSDVWIGAYQRTKPLAIMLVISFALLTTASFIDKHTVPSFRSAYSDCLSAMDGNNGSYRGTINRQSSCVVIARAVVNQTKEE